jgi:hypothetical protein
MKQFKLIIFMLMSIALKGVAQSDSFDVFIYNNPEFFTKSALPERVQFSLSNNDTSFCTITLYKSQSAKGEIKKQINSQWSGYVVKQYTKADKKPQRILTEQMWDGWASTLAIGNFYQGKKKCVAILNTFTRNGRAAVVVFAMTDKSFQHPVEVFSNQLHLKNDQRK